MRFRDAVPLVTAGFLPIRQVLLVAVKAATEMDLSAEALAKAERKTAEKSFLASQTS
jgi:hypothetical protein